MSSQFYVTLPSIVDGSISRYLPQRKAVGTSEGWTNIKSLSTRSNRDTLDHSDPLPEGIVKVIGKLGERPKINMTRYVVDGLLRIMTERQMGFNKLLLWRRGRVNEVRRYILKRDRPFSSQERSPLWLVLSALTPKPKHPKYLSRSQQVGEKSSVQSYYLQRCSLHTIKTACYITNQGILLAKVPKIVAGARWDICKCLSKKKNWIWHLYRTPQFAKDCWNFTHVNLTGGSTGALFLHLVTKHLFYVSHPPDTHMCRLSHFSFPECNLLP